MDKPDPNARRNRNRTSDSIMTKKDNFYIGWQPKMAKETKRVIVIFIVAIAVIVFTLIFWVVNKQKPFNAHNFEYGKLTTITGTYYANPAPILVADAFGFPVELSKDILLVGYGKFGAEGILQSAEKAKKLMNGSKVKLQGTLIYGDGRTLLELTEKEASVIEVYTGEKQEVNNETKRITKHLKGEILDPKCYFGVMKPGEGKIHKSCAIRCISGGVPPVLRVMSDEGYQYYIMVGGQGQQMNKEVLPYVAETIDVNGKTAEINGWNFIYMDNIEYVKK